MTAPETLIKVEQACADLLQEGEPVTFTTVAAAAGVSRTTLYRDPTLRMVVEEQRTHSHNPRTMSGLVSEIGHLRIAVEALAERVRRYEEQLRRLELPLRHKLSSR
jgi:Family of unknown function (DUF6262)